MKPHILIAFVCSLLFSPLALAEDFGSEGFSLDIGGGLSYMDAQLEGTGFAGKLPSTQGMAYGAVVSRGWSKRGMKLSLKYNQAQADMDAPSTVTPSSISAVRSEYGLSLLATASETFLGSFRYGAGYQVVQYAVDDNTPALITDQTTYGFAIYLERDIQFSEKWFSTLDLSVYAPNNFSERDANSGFNARFLGLGIGYQLNFKVKEELAIYLGVDYRRDAVGFSGTGARGTTNARDTRTLISVPVGIRWDFF